MDIFNLINMKKDMLLGNYSYVDESYEEIYDYQNDYIDTISENFDLALENANMQLFQCGTDDYIYNLLEENEYWDITEESVIESVGSGIKKIIDAIISLIKKIGSFISGLFNKITGLFKKSNDEMEKVNNDIAAYNKAVSGQKNNNKNDNIIKNDNNNKNDIESEMNKEMKRKKYDIYNYSLGPNQSLNTLYNRFGKEIKIISPIYKKADMGVYDFWLNGLYDRGMKRLIYEVEENNITMKNASVLSSNIAKSLKYNTMDDVKKNIKNEAYKGFMENYKDQQPFSKKISISDIPFDVINWYANNSDELKSKVDKINNAYKKDLNNTQARLEKLNSKYAQGNKPKQYTQANKNNSNNVNGILSLIRSNLNTFAIFHKTFVMTATRAKLANVNMCKMLRNRIYAKTMNE